MLLDGATREIFVDSLVMLGATSEEPLTEEHTWYKSGSLTSRLIWIQENMDADPDIAHQELGSSSAVYVFLNRNLPTTGLSNQCAQFARQNGGAIPMKLIIDTDIGTDPDDAIAIAYAIKSGVEIPLITTVHGNMNIRGNIAKKLTELLGADIPVAQGEGTPIKQTHIYWTGLEGKGFLNGKDSYDVRKDGVDALAESVYANKGEVNIAAIGPLTNIARAFERYPDLPEHINHVYMMGNAILCEHTYHLNYRSHNFKVDPEAIDQVMAADVSKTIITTEDTRRKL